jgi:hypothetical protein
MRLSNRTKATFAVALALVFVGGGAWAQNLEVKGSAWFSTAGGNTGVGTVNPLGRLHVTGAGGVANENTDGTSQLGTVPFVAQTDGTALAILNADARQVFGLAVQGNGHTSTQRGSPAFMDRADGTWNTSIVLNRGRVGVGRVPATYRFELAGDSLTEGWVRTTGPRGWYNETYGSGWYMEDSAWIRTLYGKSVWVGGGLLGGDGGLTVGHGGATPPPNGALLRGTVTVGDIATYDPYFKLHVNGSIAAANSEIVFTKTDHAASTKASGSGQAGIENVNNNGGTLRILGRAGTSVGRRVDVYDYLQVNGDSFVTGKLSGAPNNPGLYLCPGVSFNVPTYGGGTTTVTYCQGLAASSSCTYPKPSGGTGTVACPLVGRLIAP